ncbi:MAG TPA: response regulator [Candidatus Omnitrophota bacterium]|nr:response regulator [Candidatus Omnitrophota bacterium]
MHKLLTIDDEVEFTNLIQNYFGPRGYQVIVANKGDEGLKLAASEKPDVCLIDLKMPGMHGDEVLKNILSKEPKAKCIMITASEGEEKVRTHLMSLGAYTCFDKPITSLKDLESKIKEALQS